MIPIITTVNLASIDLNLLLVLHAVLEERSVTRAARRLGLSQPAVSNALARLRAVLGDRLVVRAGGSLEPTPRAAAVLPQLAAGLRELAGVVDVRAFDAATTTRTFTLADSAELSELPRLAGAFARQLPRAMLRLVTTIDPAEALARGDADVVLGPLVMAGAGLIRRKLYDDHRVLVIRRGHPHARAPRKLLAARRIVVEGAAVDGGVAMVMPDYMSAALAVSTCDLVAELPARFARAISRLLPLRIAPGRGPRAQPATATPVALHWHERTHGDPGCHAFRALICEALGTR